jgi:hypothetical protein
MSGDHNQYQKPTSKDILQVETIQLALDAKPVVESKKRKWIGLTDKEILKLYRVVTKSAWDCFMYARVIEARLKEKNT